MALAVVNHGTHVEFGFVVGIDMQRTVADVTFGSTVDIGFYEGLEFGIVLGESFMLSYGDITFVASSDAENGSVHLGLGLQILRHHSFAVVRTEIASQRQVYYTGFLLCVGIIENAGHTLGNEIILQQTA